MNNLIIDTNEIKKAITLITDGVFECRIINGRKILSGYFIGSDALVDRLSNIDLNGANVYITLQRLHEGCEARKQWECFLETGFYKLPTTSDNDVIDYKWLPIDIDPVRPAGISSSYEELEDANEVCAQVKAYMEEQGFRRYIRGFSGNGFHLLYDIADRANKGELVSSVIDKLDSFFSNDAAKVDTTVSNPSRIWKLYGTYAQKGRYTNKRPFRLARILEVQL